MSLTHMSPLPTTIGAGEFKATCLKLLDEVASSRVPLVITKHGKAVAKLVPMPSPTALFGALTGSVLNDGDIVSPIDAGWDAAR
jgi:prevent-host-death family protein